MENRTRGQSTQENIGGGVNEAERRKNIKENLAKEVGVVLQKLEEIKNRLKEDNFRIEGRARNPQHLDRLINTIKSLTPSLGEFRRETKIVVENLRTFIEREMDAVENTDNIVIPSETQQALEQLITTYEESRTALHPQRRERIVLLTPQAKAAKERDDAGEIAALLENLHLAEENEKQKVG